MLLDEGKLRRGKTETSLARNRECFARYWVFPAKRKVFSAEWLWKSTVQFLSGTTILVRGFFRVCVIH